jgi:antirestriction protein ArdC
MQSRADIRNLVTDRIVKMLEQGTVVRAENWRA